MLKSAVPINQQQKEQIEHLSKVKLSEALMTEFFPNENLPDSFHNFLRDALKFNSIGRLQCDPKTYESLIFHRRPFTMAEMHLALGVLQNATPVEMNQTIEANFEMIRDVVDSTMQSWNVIYSNLQIKIKREVEAKVRAGIQIVKTMPQ